MAVASISCDFIHKHFPRKSFHLKLCILKSTYKNLTLARLLLSFNRCEVCATLDKEGNPHMANIYIECEVCSTLFFFLSLRTIEIHYLTELKVSSFQCRSEQLSTFKLFRHANSRSLDFVPHGQNSLC